MLKRNASNQLEFKDDQEINATIMKNDSSYALITHRRIVEQKSVPAFSMRGDYNVAIIARIFLPAKKWMFVQTHVLDDFKVSFPLTFHTSPIPSTLIWHKWQI